MSGSAIIWYKLKTNSNLIAVVPATKIKIGEITLNTDLAAISVHRVHGDSWAQIKDDGLPKLRKERIQVTIAAKTVPSREQVLFLVQDAVQSSYGDVNGTLCNGILDDVVGPDINDDENKLFFTSQDFIVSYTR